MLRFKNKLVRAFTFCLISSILIITVMPHQSFMGILGVTFFTVAFFLIFRDEKLIEKAFSKRYRFSLIRQLYNLENLVYSRLPQKFKKYSTQFSILFIISIHALFIEEMTYLIISLPLVLIISWIYRD